MRTSPRIESQQPSPMPIHKYRPFTSTNPVPAFERTWPTRTIEKAPRWLSTDLRDGNQALIEPMNPDRKREMFKLLVQMGYKEIEIGFPAASQTDYDFVRSLVENDLVPDDVTVSVLTQARADLIERTVYALEGFARANVHMYNATAPVFREVVFGNDRADTVAMAQAGTREVMKWMEKILGDDTVVGYQYSPEIFVDTELDFALEVCESVMDVWQPDGEREIILNLPATVERATPNVYADQIEWMSTHLSRREHVALSVHPHNDRGTAVAAAELAMLAGADRVEGCLLGQGERTGNVDLLTLALNLFSQGIDPQVDLRDVDQVRRVVEHCTQMDTPPRHPYVGDLVYTSFSGSHQDAIKKGFAARRLEVDAAGGDEDAVVWQMPYLPIDPHDVGRSYEAIVRVNSQSGKGGIAYLMHSVHKLDLPRRLQIDFSRTVQRHSDQVGGEIDAQELWRIFTDEYLPTQGEDGLEPWGEFRLGRGRVLTHDEGDRVKLEVNVTRSGVDHTVQAWGNGPVDAFVAALRDLGVEVYILDYAEHALSSGGDAKAAAYVEVEVAGEVVWGVGIDPSITVATHRAVISAVNRALRK
ncbi:MAG: 2-isopropylmalate synthase [Actinomycetaceae bacterium]|nr:2-isopropylmalate synthase [Actinomycetaceae bacterium]